MNKTKIENLKDFKVGIVGLGPVGMITAVHLKEAGCNVAICDHDKIKVNLIRKEGIKLEEAINKHSFFEHIFTNISELKELDLDIVIFALKTYQLTSVLKEIYKLKNDHLCVVSAQNGLDSEQILSGVFGESKTLRMVINYAGNMNAPNVVKVTFFNGPNYIASMDDSKEAEANYLSRKLTDVSLDTKTIHSFEIIKRVWEKNILNAALSPICAIGKLTIREAMQISDTVEIVEVIIQEGLEVAEAEKIKFDDDFMRIAMRYFKKAGNHFPSLAVDLMNNRETEIDYMNGKLVEYGRKHYIRTSLNLALTNMVKAITQKNTLNTGAILSANTTVKKHAHQIEMGNDRKLSPLKNGEHFLGVDLGSAFVKFAVIDGNDEMVYTSALKTVNKDRLAIRHVLEALKSEYAIKYSCATGYGRKHFYEADIIKTEINCAAAGVSRYFSGPKNIIDIGGEDIKIIRCDDFDNVDSFYLNDKCSAGTGSFISEVAERSNLNVSEMSGLASKSEYAKELNSFCTVFAKTEIMNWLYSGVSIQDISKGIYLSLANKVARLKVDTSVNSYMIGGVIAHHPYLKNLLEEKLSQEIQIIEKPQHIVAYGAALIAKQSFLKRLEKSGEEITTLDNNI
ncbi:MAG: 2-dehydropantoate 2-reductase [Ignavibacteria bacterium]